MTTYLCMCMAEYMVLLSTYSLYVNICKIMEEYMILLNIIHMSTWYDSLYDTSD